MADILGLAPQSVYRNGDKLEVPRGAKLLPYCVKCGQPASGEPIQKTFMWHNPLLFLLILVNLLVYAIVAMVVRKKFPLAVPLCEAHRSRRRTLLWIGIVLLIGGIPGSILVGSLVGGDDGAILGLFLWLGSFVAGLIVILPCRSLMNPKYIDETRGTFTGVADVYLMMFPTRPDAIPSHNPTE